MFERYCVRLVGSDCRLQIEVDAARNIEDLGALMARTRCVIGRLVVENGEQVDPPVRVLIPANRVDLIVGREE